MACNACGHVFDEDDLIRETEYTGVHSEGFSETVERQYCPNCGDDYVEEARRCQFCGGWSADWVCPECKIIIRTALNDLVKMSATLHKLNGIKFREASAHNAIVDELEDM